MEQIKLFEDAIEREAAIQKMGRGSDQDKAYEEFYDGLTGWKCSLYNKYFDAKQRGNQFIDFSDCPDEKEIPALVACLRECGVEHITISSGWSGLVERLWAFHQSGCTITGMVEVNSRSKNWETKEYEKEPALLLVIKQEKE